jgi:integrase
MILHSPGTPCCGPWRATGIGRSPVHGKATQGKFRDLVRNALMTDCHYSELTRMWDADFNASAGTVTVRLSKSGKPRRVVLADEGRALFEQQTVGRTAKPDLQARRWRSMGSEPSAKAACRSLGYCEAGPAGDVPHLAPYLCLLSCDERRVMGVIAAQLGHSDTRMTEKNYAHLRRTMWPKRSTPLYRRSGL